MPSIRTKFARDPARRAQLIAVVTGLSPAGRVQFFAEVKLWEQTAENGRDVIGVLNRRYDCCIYRCGSAAPWFAVAFDTQEREFVIALDVPNGQMLDCHSCVRACAEALGEPVRESSCD
jgi:hypothetical protein